MPERRRLPEGWRALGRLLPREVRERVFEPAYTDLVRAWLTRTPGRTVVPFWISALGTFLGCVPIAAPHLLVRRGRLTRFGKGLVWAATSLTVVWLVLMRMASTYAATSTGP